MILILNIFNINTAFISDPMVRATLLDMSIGLVCGPVTLPIPHQKFQQFVRRDEASWKRSNANEQRRSRELETMKKWEHEHRFD